LARAGQGEPFIVTDPEVAPGAAEKFGHYISTPVLTRLKLQFDGFETYDVEPNQVPDLMAQRPLVVFGKWRGSKGGRIVIEGKTGGALYRSTHDVASATALPSAEGLARLWARSRIAQLGDEAFLPGTGDQKAAITNLGLTYNLLTRYTSFVAVDEVVRRTTPTLQTVKQPVPLPAGVENSAVGGTGVGAAPEPSLMALAAVGALALAVAMRKRRRAR
jgi:Ca-activated chloride channel family protein